MKCLYGVKRFLVSEDGPTTVEYAVLLALILVVCTSAIQSLGKKNSAVFNDVKSHMKRTR